MRAGASEGLAALSDADDGDDENMRINASEGRADVSVDANDEDFPADTLEESLSHKIQREDKACVDEGVVF